MRQEANLETALSAKLPPMTKTHAHLQKENQVNISTVHWKIVFSLLHIFQEIELREEGGGRKQSTEMHTCAAAHFPWLLLRKLLSA